MTALDDMLAKADDILSVDACPRLRSLCRPTDDEIAMARALKAVAEALEEVAECGHVSALVLTDAVRAAIERRLTRKDEP